MRTEIAEVLGLCAVWAGCGVLAAEPQMVNESARQIPVAYSVDVVVVGGGTGAVSAAVAAKQAGAKVIIIPKANAKDLTEIPAQVRKGLTFVQVEHMDDVLRHALERVPKGHAGHPEPPGETPPEVFTRH